MQKNKITHLKIKTKYLAAEARIIKLEERKALKRHKKRSGGQEPLECPGVKLHYGGMGHGSWKAGLPEAEDNSSGCRCHCARYKDLRNHRHNVVRFESRHNLLAYGFVRGRSYARIESRCAKDNWPDFAKVKKIAKRFNPGIEDFDECWADWEREAVNHLKSLSNSYEQEKVEEVEKPQQPEPVEVVAPKPQAEQPEGIIAKVIATVKG